MSRWSISHALALILLDGAWEYDAMLARLLAAVELGWVDDDDDEPPSWMSWLVHDACTTFASAPLHAIDRFASWIASRDPYAEALENTLQIVRYPTPTPEMREGRWPVPALATHRELASWLGIDGTALTVLADVRSIARTSREQRHRHYRYAWIRKPRGGHRLVEAPKPRLRGVQRAILDGIVGAITPHDAAHGFRPGRSVVGAARLHVGRAVVVRVDLQSFFASVNAARVAGLFRTAGYPEQVAHTLAALCTHHPPIDVLAAAPHDARDPLDLARLRMPHLPQGAPTSGALANLAAYRLDVRIAAYAAKLGATYTRYADDIVLSSDDRGLVRAATTVVARLAAIAAEEGFSLNYRKTRVMTAANRQRVTGIVVNEKLGASREDVERLRAVLHNCRRHGPATQNRDEHPDFRAYLRGKIAWVTSLDAAKGARLRAMFEQIDWDPPQSL
jgi:RNA-directed DNA polymerase